MAERNAIREIGLAAQDLYALFRRPRKEEDYRRIDEIGYARSLQEQLGEAERNNREGRVPHLLVPSPEDWTGEAGEKVKTKVLFDSLGIRDPLLLLLEPRPTDPHLDPDRDDPYKRIRLRLEMTKIEARGETKVKQGERQYLVILSGKFGLTGSGGHEISLPEEQLFVGPLNSTETVRNLGEEPGVILKILLTRRDGAKWEFETVPVIDSLTKTIGEVFEREKARKPGIMFQSSENKRWFVGPVSRKGAGQVKEAAIGMLLQPHFHLEAGIAHRHHFLTQVVCSLPTDLASDEASQPLFGGSTALIERDRLGNYGVIASGSGVETKIVPPNRCLLMINLMSPEGKYLKEDLPVSIETYTTGGVIKAGIQSARERLLTELGNNPIYDQEEQSGGGDVEQIRKSRPPVAVYDPRELDYVY